MDEKIKCKLNLISKSAHTSSIVTGYIMLKNSSEIELEINKCVDKKKYPHEHMVEVVLNDSTVIAYDLLDGYNWDEDSVEKYLKKCDFYFKRSYNKKLHSHIDGNEKIYPLGLNYNVTVKSNPIDEKNIKRKIGHLIKCIVKLKPLNNTANFYVNKFEDKPKAVINSPQVLFYTRLWSPYGELGENLNGDKAVIEERNYINKTRVEIIRKLRIELGENFLGGLSPTPYAKENFNDCVLSHNDCQRVNYLERVKEADICIANMGLYKSTGWKFAEYVAASKAIISEQLYYEVPNGFNEGKNYLGFTNSLECIDRVMELINDKKKLLEIKEANYQYYLEHLRPDKQIIDTLMIALK